SPDRIGATATTNRRKIMFLDGGSHALGGNQTLRIVSIKQERCKFLAPKSRTYITRAQRFSNYRADVFQRFASNQMAVSVVDFFEMIKVHHQHAEWHVLGFRARGFTTQLGKKRFASQ